MAISSPHIIQSGQQNQNRLTDYMALANQGVGMALDLHKHRQLLEEEQRQFDSNVLTTMMANPAVYANAAINQPDLLRGVLSETTQFRGKDLDGVMTQLSSLANMNPTEQADHLLSFYNSIGVDLSEFQTYEDTSGGSRHVSVPQAAAVPGAGVYTDPGFALNMAFQQPPEPPAPEDGEQGPGPGGMGGISAAAATGTPRADAQQQPVSSTVQTYAQSQSRAPMSGLPDTMPHLQRFRNVDLTQVSGRDAGALAGASTEVADSLSFTGEGLPRPLQSLVEAAPWSRKDAWENYSRDAQEGVWGAREDGRGANQYTPRLDALTPRMMRDLNIEDTVQGRDEYNRSRGILQTAAMTGKTPEDLANMSPEEFQSEFFWAVDDRLETHEVSRLTAIEVRNNNNAYDHDATQKARAEAFREIILGKTNVQEGLAAFQAQGGQFRTSEMVLSAAVPPQMLDKMAEWVGDYTSRVMTGKVSVNRGALRDALQLNNRLGNLSGRMQQEFERDPDAAAATLAGQTEAVFNNFPGGFEGAKQAVNGGYSLEAEIAGFAYGMLQDEAQMSLARYQIGQTEYQMYLALASAGQQENIGRELFDVGKEVLSAFGYFELDNENDRKRFLDRNPEAKAHFEMMIRGSGMMSGMAVRPVEESYRNWGVLSQRMTLMQLEDSTITQPGTSGMGQGELEAYLRQHNILD